MAWSGTYSTQITKKLNNLSNQKYDPQYDKQINSTANQIANYQPYQSKYGSQIDSITNQINNYGPYQSKYGSQLNNIANQVSNYQPYTSKYQNQIDNLAGQITNWDYDPEQDKSYQAYKNQYTTMGNKAMRDTLGQVSSRTGGLASSYAGSAAQQTYDGYMQQLANIIPQLEQQAYNRANTSLGVYQSLDNTDYGRYQDTLSNLMNRGSYLQGVDATDYGRYRDALGDLYNKGSYLQGLDQTDYGRWYDALNNLYNQNNMYLGMDQNMYNRFLGDQNLGYQQLSAMQDYNDWEYQMWLDDLARAQAAASAGGGGGGGGRGRSGGGGNGSNSSSGSTAAYKPEAWTKSTALNSIAGNLVNSTPVVKPNALQQAAELTSYGALSSSAIPSLIKKYSK